MAPPCVSIAAFFCSGPKHPFSPLHNQSMIPNFSLYLPSYLPHKPLLFDGNHHRPRCVLLSSTSAVLRPSAGAILQTFPCMRIPCLISCFSSQTFLDAQKKPSNSASLPFNKAFSVLHEDTFIMTTLAAHFHSPLFSFSSCETLLLLLHLWTLVPVI